MNTTVASRALHLVDIENLIGAPRGPRWGAADALARYLVTSGWVPGDHVVVAGPPALILQLGTEAKIPCRSVVAAGPNAADLALIAAADPTFVARRFGRVVLGSGDGIFARLVSELTAAGVDVTVVGRGGSVSKRLTERAPVLRIDLLDHQLRSA